MGSPPIRIRARLRGVPQNASEKKSASAAVAGPARRRAEADLCSAPWKASLKRCPDTNSCLRGPPRPMSEFDAQIAAITRVHGATLATRTRMCSKDAESGWSIRGRDESPTSRARSAREMGHPGNAGYCRSSLRDAAPMPAFSMVSASFTSRILRTTSLVRQQFKWPHHGWYALLMASRSLGSGVGGP